MCTAYDDECTYETTQDGRKPVSREYVNALQQRVADLEAKLHVYETASKSTAEQDLVGQDDGNGQSSISAVENFKILSDEEVGQFMTPMTPVRPGGRQPSELTRAVCLLFTVMHGPTSSYLHLGQAADPKLDNILCSPGHRADSADDYESDSVEATLDQVLLTSLVNERASDIPGWNTWLPPHVPPDLHDELLGYFFSYVNPFTLFVVNPFIHLLYAVVDVPVCVGRMSCDFCET